MLRTLVCFVSFLAIASALECYVCDNQPDNKGKCVKTSIQCAEEYDTCMTRIKWEQPPYWVERGQRIHIIFKTCTIASRCAQHQKEIGIRCARDWYRGWECFECCQGDRCNYYVTLGASTTKISILVLVAVAIVHLVWRDLSQKG